MNIKKTMANGLPIYELSQEELYALLNFSSINKKRFPFNVFETNANQIDQGALAGYSSLMQNGCFEVNDKGYPALTEKNRAVVNTITALRKMDELMTVRLTMNRKSLTLIIAHIKEAWSIIWRTGKKWFLIGGDGFLDVSVSVINLIEAPIRKSLDGGPNVTLDFIWYSSDGTNTMSTTIKNKSGEKFREAKPSSEVLAMSSPSWPKSYFFNGVLTRIENLIGIIAG